MDETQTILGKHSALAESERMIAYLQGDVEYYKKMQWSSDIALKKEVFGLKKLQTEYYEEFKKQRGNQNEDN